VPHSRDMKRRLRVGVMFGGRSGEHEVSLRSASAVIAALDPGRYEVLPIAVGKDGRWRTGPEVAGALEAAQQALEPIAACGVEVVMPPRPGGPALVPTGGGDPIALDVVFPVLHGTYGEDGTVQGLLELADVPYVGAGVLASAAGMDKAVMKSLFHDARIPVCRWLLMRPGEDAAAAVERQLGWPCFVKPANLGSSVGISKVKGSETFAAAVAEAARYDGKVLAEEAIAGREFEVGVLGNADPAASVVGELVPSHEFYDYADKYVEEGARTVIPASLPSEVSEHMRSLALAAFRAIDCAGFARVDFFLEQESGRVLVNEINTIPGFTAASMFPKLWAASGMPFAAVVDRLIELGLERHAARARRSLSFTPPVPAAAAAPPRRARRSAT